jgi:hypothetical protein
MSGLLCCSFSVTTKADLLCSSSRLPQRSRPLCLSSSWECPHASASNAFLLTLVDHSKLQVLTSLRAILLGCAAGGCSKTGVSVSCRVPRECNTHAFSNVTHTKVAGQPSCHAASRHCMQGPPSSHRSIHRYSLVPVHLAWARPSATRVPISPACPQP